MGGKLAVEDWLCLYGMIFIYRKDRFSVQEKERNEVKMKELEVEAKKMVEDRRKHTLKVNFLIDYLFNI